MPVEDLSRRTPEAHSQPNNIGLQDALASVLASKTGYFRSKTAAWNAIDAIIGLIAVGAWGDVELYRDMWERLVQQNEPMVTVEQVRKLDSRTE